MTDNEKALVWLCCLPELELRERAMLLRAAGSPAKLFSEWEKFTPLLINSRKSGLYKEGESARLRQADRLISRLNERGIFTITPFSEDYPESLQSISLPPLVLFGRGNRALMQREKFCIVGSRILPPWAEKTGKSLSRELSERFVIVTGLAEGGDAAAIEGALASGSLVSVLPNGMEKCYPAAHAALKEKIAKRGLLLSECPPDEGVKKYSFHARNRILAGLSRGVLVLGASEKSGALITANYALEYGRDVFALPHNAGVKQGEGCNRLLKNGAYLVTEGEDILSVYGLSAGKKEKISLSSEEERMLGALREYGELHIAELAERAGMRVYEAAAVLSSLEIKNLAVKSGGNKYSAV